MMSHLHSGGVGGWRGVQKFTKVVSESFLKGKAAGLIRFSRKKQKQDVPNFSRVCHILRVGGVLGERGIMGK